MALELDKIIDDAYALYMPQIRSEIVDLAKMIQSNMQGATDRIFRREFEFPRQYNILEIGTKFGGTFYIWNQLIQDHGAGMCISIDMDDGGKHGGIGSDQMNKRDLWFQKRFDNCHFIRGDSHNADTILKLLKLYIGPNQTNLAFFDFLFIDGDHTYDGVKKDFEMYSPFVKKGGFIAFHDITISDNHHSRDVYVGEFWNEIKDDYKHFEFTEPGNNWGGIGVLVI